MTLLAFATNCCKRCIIVYQQNTIEKLTIKNLRSNQDIIIYSADKESKIVCREQKRINTRTQKSTIKQHFLYTNRCI